MLLALGPSTCTGAAVVCPLSLAWDIRPHSMVMLSHDTEAYQLQTQVEDWDFLQFL